MILLQQGKTEFYGDLVTKLKKIFGNPPFSDVFKQTYQRFQKGRVKLKY